MFNNCIFAIVKVLKKDLDMDIHSYKKQTQDHSFPCTFRKYMKIWKGIMKSVNYSEFLDFYLSMNESHLRISKMEEISEETGATFFKRLLYQLFGKLSRD